MRQKGSILVYILIAIFLTGMLIASMTQGAKKSASSEQINEMMMYLQQDLRSIQANITECVVSYQNNNFCPPNAAETGVSCVSQYGSVAQSGTPDFGNYNAPFPMPSVAAGGTGVALTSMICPRAPSATNTIFTANITQSLKLLQDTSNYTVTYYNNATDGVYLRITRAVTDPLWAEVLNRLPSKYQTCVTKVTTGTDPTGFSCGAAGCFYYFIKRPGPGPGSPVLTCP